MKTPAELAISTARRIDTVNSFGVCITERRNNALMAAKIQQYNDASIKPATTLDPKKNKINLLRLLSFHSCLFLVITNYIMLYS